MQKMVNNGRGHTNETSFDGKDQFPLVYMKYHQQISRSINFIWQRFRAYKILFITTQTTVTQNDRDKQHRFSVKQGFQLVYRLIFPTLK